MAEWPKRADGTNKSIREMTREEARAVTKAACGRVQKHFDRPEVKAGIKQWIEASDTRHPH